MSISGLGKPRDSNVTTDKKICLDLFAGLGGFSQAFEESEQWNVIGVELNDDFEPDIVADILDLRPADLPEPDVVLASPPCTDFSPMAWSHETRIQKDGTPVTESAKQSVALVYHTLGLIKSLSPEYWFLENPKGALRWVIGEPVATVDYCRYGHYTKKPTDLWGEHPPMDYLRCNHKSHTRSDGTTDMELGPSNPSERAKVPYELSKTIFNAVEGGGKQSTLAMHA